MARRSRLRREREETAEEIRLADGFYLMGFVEEALPVEGVEYIPAQPLSKLQALTKFGPVGCKRPTRKEMET